VDTGSTRSKPTFAVHRSFEADGSTVGGIS